MYAHTHISAYPSHTLKAVQVIFLCLNILTLISSWKKKVTRSTKTALVLSICKCVMGS